MNGKREVKKQTNRLIKGTKRKKPQTKAKWGKSLTNRTPDKEKKGREEQLHRMPLIIPVRRLAKALHLRKPK